jgi:NitT/TauT family transport system substrate-binding protein
MSQQPSGSRSAKNLAYATTGLVVAAAMLGAGDVWVSRVSPPPSAEPPEQVTIASIRSPAACPVIVAQANGYFAKEGLAVAIQSQTSGKATLDVVFGGQANLATSGDLPVMFAVMDRQPVSIVATLATGENNLGVVGRKDRGVVTPASLKGKQVGVPMVSAGQFVLDVILTREKLSMSEVTVRDLRPEELAAALAKGDIDAASTWQPYLGTLQTQLGENGTTFHSAGIYDVAVSLVGTRTYVAEHPQTIKKVLRALIVAAHFCKDSPDAARALVAEAMKPDTPNLKELWSSYRFNVVLDQSLILALEDETRWAIKNRLTERTDAPNYLDSVHLDALETVAPSAVTIMH